MRSVVIVSLILGLLISCKSDDQGPAVYFERNEDQYEKFINTKPMPDNVNLGQDKYIENKDYPIKVALYNDGKFYYYLDKLWSGTSGTGTYQYVDGELKLHAIRYYKVLGGNIDLNFSFAVTASDSSESVLTFRDKSKLNVKKMTLIE